MCGIVGVFNIDGKKVDLDILHKMDCALKHRGPDGHGEYLDSNVGLANRRLAILDTSIFGSQPMRSSDGRYVITFNGEVFNFLELKQELLMRGYKFSSHTDTEVVLYGYASFGETIVEKLIGQFAFCILDRKNSSLFLARDHLGVNPLFYANIGNTFLFASEVKGILASGLVKKE